MSNTEVCPVCRCAVPAGSAVCVSCGFKLLGKTQEFKPISIDTARGKTVTAEPSVASFKVVRGPQTGVVYRLDRDRITIGRSPECDVFLNDMTVSRTHAHLKREGDCYIISDDNSYNGVWVNNQDIKMKALATGDFIQIGTFCLFYEEQNK